MTPPVRPIPEYPPFDPSQMVMMPRAQNVIAREELERRRAQAQRNAAVRAERQAAWQADQDRQRQILEETDPRYIINTEVPPEEWGKYRPLGQRMEEGVWDFTKQFPRGLAESGYATGMGVTSLLGAEGATEAQRRSREEMRGFYGEPEGGAGFAGQIAGDIVGTGAQMMAPGALIGRLGTVSAGAPRVMQMAANLGLGGAGVEGVQAAGDYERSLLGFVPNEQVQELAKQSPWFRAAVGALPEGLFMASPAVRQYLRRAKTAPETRFMEVSAEDFDRGLKEFVKQKPDQAGFVTFRTPDEMREEGMRMFLEPGGRAGFAIHPETGDMRNLFNIGGVPGTGAYGMSQQLAMGGRIGDAFDAGLMDIYRPMGMEETWRAKWDPKYKPAGWREDLYGTPDVVGFEYRGLRLDPATGKPFTADDYWREYQKRRELTGKTRYEERAPFRERLEALIRAPIPQGATFGSILGGASQLGDVELLRNMKRMKDYLAPDERVFTQANRGNMRRVIDMFKQMPTSGQLSSAALAGKAKRGWYRKSSQALVDAYGPDAPRFASLLAAMSPQISVEGDLRNAMSVWNGWVAAGRPTDPGAIRRIMADNVQRGDYNTMPLKRLKEVRDRANKELGKNFTGNTTTDIRRQLNTLTDDEQGYMSVMPAWVTNTQRSLTVGNPGEYMLSGPKVDSFMRNLLEDTEAVTLDTWMAKVANIQQKNLRGRELADDAFGYRAGKTGKYVGYSARIRETANDLSRVTGDVWTPEEVQETVWSWAMALDEMAGSGKRTKAGQLQRRVGELTEAEIMATPDFSKLLQEGEYAQMLQAGGLPLPQQAAAAGGGLGIGSQFVPSEAQLKKLARNLERSQTGQYKF